jgi:L-ascorbate peroxidase
MSCFSCFGGLADSRKTALKKAKDDVDKLILEKSFAPLFVRFAWHDSGTFDIKHKDKPWPAAGGAIGSIIYDKELSAGPNAGLKLAKTVLSKIKDQHNVGWADLIQLASSRAVELSGGPKIPMRYGRLDASESPELSEAPFGLPDALAPFGGPPGCEQDPAAHLRYVFYKYGMNDEDIVALSGAHTLGRAFKERSGTVDFGYSNPTEYTQKGCPFAGKSLTSGGQSWTKEWLKFDNSYFQLPGKTDGNCVAFPTDCVLAEDPGFKVHFDLFANDERAFFKAYARSHKKLSELGSKFERPFSL